MKKVLTVIALAATLGVTAVATSSPADAWWRGGGGWGWRGGWGGWGWRGPGPWVAGAVVGGAVVGAAAVASRPYYYNGYYPYGPYQYYGGGCRRVWNGYYWTRACY
jgi:hypothetical protein